MSEKISKISVDGQIYDLSIDTSSVDSKVSELEQKISEEAVSREESDANLQKNIEAEATRVDAMVNQINENVASSIETLNNNLVQAIETINGGIAAEVSAREEGDKVLQSSIDELTEKINGESGELAGLEEKVENISSDIKAISNEIETVKSTIEEEIRPELDKAVKYEDTATEQNPGRKSILLNNHDNILGKTTDGNAINIAMVSKWDVVDLGSSSAKINLNGSEERPTYNDVKQIAFLEDVNGNLGTINLVKKDDLTYELQVGDRVAGTINIPEDQFLKSVEYSAEDKSLTFVFNTSEGEQTSVVDLSSLVDTYISGNGLELSGNIFSIKLDPASEIYLSVSEAGIKVEGIDAINTAVQGVAADLQKINESLTESIEVVDKKIEEEIRPELDKAVKYEDVADSNLPERKAIVLKNGDVILGGNLNGGTSSLVQLNRWGVADFGSSSVPFNINTPKGVRPTIQEAGQSGEEAHKIAYLEDVESGNANIEEVKAALELKADKSEVEEIKVALETKADKSEVALKANQEDVDFQVNAINEKLEGKADKSEVALKANQADVDFQVNAINEKLEGKADKESVVEYKEFDGDRKTIQLDNYDSISGVATDGTGHNLVMLSKWDVADFGASGVRINLNGSAERPTYNDTEEIALIKDIETAKGEFISYKTLEDGTKTIELANNDSISGVNSEGIAGFNLAKITADDKTEIGSAGLQLNLVGAAPRPVFNGDKGVALSEDLELRASELQADINLRALQSDLEAYMSATSTKVDELEGKIGSIPSKVSELENDSDYQNASQVNARIQEVVAAAPEALDTLKELADALGNDPNFAGTVTAELAKKANSEDVYTKKEADAKFITEHQSLEGLATEKFVEEQIAAIPPVDLTPYATKEEIEGQVKYKDIPSEQLPNRKAIELAKGDMLLGGGNNLVQLNRWGVVDLGTSVSPINMNTPKDVRPTVQEAGQSGEEAHKIAYLEDVESVSVALEEKQDKGDYALKSDLEGLATETWVESKGYLTEHQDISELATKEEVAEAVKNSVDYKEFGEGRKTIQLSNYDSISGIATDGIGHNLAMVSKWDVADFGAPGLKVNLNGSAERPTYNDTKEIALVEDINIAVEDKADKSEVALKANQADVDFQVNAINEKLDTKATKEEVEEATKDSVKYEEYVSGGKRTIQLANNDNISGLDTTGLGHNLAMVSKWNKADFGAAGLELNLNGSAERPTYNDTEEIALVKDVDAKVASISIPSKVSEFENDSDYQNAEQVNARIQEVVGTAPEALDTLKELADALGNDPNFASTITLELMKKANSTEVDNKLAEKADKVHTHDISDVIDLQTLLDKKANLSDLPFVLHSNGIFNKFVSTKFRPETLGRGAICSGKSSSSSLLIEASGEFAHAEGNSTKAIGDTSHAEGYNTKAEGSSSHAEGFNTRTVGMFSHAEGYFTEAVNEAEHASGKYNVSTEGKTLFSVGNGTSKTDRKNALEVQLDGTTYLSSSDKVYFGESKLSDILPQEGEFALANHTHNIDGINGLQEALDLKADKSELTGLATETWVESKGYLTEHQDISGLATKEELAEKQNKGNYLTYNDNAGRKQIPLANSDILYSYANTEELENKVNITGSVTLLQLNKWNVVDLGSPKTITNINTPDGERPTVQEKSQSGPEAHKIAYLDDIEGLATKEEVTESSNEVLTNILGRIWTNTDKEESGNFDTSFKHADGSYARIWNETDGGGSQYYNSNKDTLSFVGVNDGNDGIHVQIYSKKKSTNVGARLNATPDGIFYGVGNSASIAPENELVVKKDITEVNTNLEAEITRATEKENMLAERLDTIEAKKLVEYEDNLVNETDPNRKVIVLNNTDALDGKSLDGRYCNLAMVNKWDVADFGSKALHINFNGAYERPTYNDKEGIALVSDVEAEKERAMEAEAKAITWYVDENNNNKKVISLDNDQLINARSNNEELEGKIDVAGRAISLIQLNKWNVVDLGSPYTLTNINTPKGVRPTVQEQGQSGPEANKIAYLSDIEALTSIINEQAELIKSLTARIEVLENK